LEQLIESYLKRFPLSKKLDQEQLALPPGPRQNYIREDGTVKGQGYFGPLPTADDGSVATELGIGVNLGGKETEIPTIVPTLNTEQLNSLLSGKRPIGRDVIESAIQHAIMRQKAGKSVWAN
jgi:hypothetical protein